MKNITLRILSTVLVLTILLGTLVVLPLSASAEATTVSTPISGTIDGNTHMIPAGDATPPTVVTPETDTEFSVYDSKAEAVAPTTTDDEGYTLITSAAEFAYVVKTVGYGDTAGNKYRLTTGIDLNKSFPFNTYSFAAELDGAGHTLANITGHLSGEAIANTACGFFKVVTGTVKNLVLTDVKVTCDYWRKPTVGSLVGTLGNGGVIDGIVMRSGKVLGTYTGNIVATVKAGEGGTATVRNCVVEASFTSTTAPYADGESHMGGIAASASTGHAVFENCYNYATPVNANGTEIKPLSAQSVHTFRYGGILGTTAQAATCTTSFTNCYNMGDFVSPRTYGQYSRSVSAGGIIGLSGNAVLTNCVNYGSLEARGDFGSHLGGLIGYAISDNNHDENAAYGYVEVYDSANYGSLSAISEAPSIGGIIGVVGDEAYSATVQDSYNYGTINATVAPATYHSSFGSSYNRNLNAYVGGIIGQLTYYRRSIDCIMTRCGNVGEIDLTLSTKQAVSVALPKDATAPAEVAVSLSLGSTLRIGGLVGRVSRTLTATDCTATADLSLNKVIEPSTATPAEGVVITGITETLKENAAYYGGIAGHVLYTSTSSLTNCTNTGHITVPASDVSYGGGIVGYAEGTSSTPTFSGCINTGNISVSDAKEAAAAGIAGYAKDATISLADCINRGAISADGTSSVKASGLVSVAKAVTALNDCANYGDVTLTGEPTNLGGLVGEMSGALTAENSSNHGTLTLNYKPITSSILTADTTVERKPTFYAGGITGKVAGAMSLTNCRNMGQLTLNITPAYEITTAATSAITVNTSTVINLFVGGAAGHVTGIATVDGFTNAHDLVVNQAAHSLTLTAQEGTTPATKGTQGLTGTDYIGGVIGKNDAGASTLTDCVNHGGIAAPGPNTVYVGGMVGHISASLTLVNCENRGNLSANGKIASAGGFIGDCPVLAADITATNSVNYGDITVTGVASAKHTNGRAGGFVGGMGNAGAGGYVDFFAYNCAQYGDVTATVANAAAASVIGYTNIGHLDKSGSIDHFAGAQIELRGCYIAGTIAGASASAGILGYHNPSDWTNGARHVDVVLDNTFLVPTLVPHTLSGNVATDNKTPTGDGLFIGYSFKSGPNDANKTDTFTITNSYVRDTVNRVAQPLNYTGNTYNSGLVTKYLTGKYIPYTDAMDDIVNDSTVLSTLNTYAVTNGYTPWIPEASLPVYVTNLTPSGATMSLAGTMQLNIKVAQSLLNSLLEVATAQNKTFSVAIKDAEETGVITALDANGYYSATYATLASEMNREMSLRVVVTVGDAQYTSNTATAYSPLTYVLNTYTNEQHAGDAELKALLTDMMYYGATAETAKYGTTAIADMLRAQGITANTLRADSNHVNDDVTQADKDAINAIALTGAGLSGSIEVTFTMQNAAYTTLTVNGDKTYKVQEGKIIFDGINASNIRTLYTLTFSGEGVADVTACFSVGVFLDGRRADANEKPLAEATILYMMSARAYVLSR